MFSKVTFAKLLSFTPSYISAAFAAQLLFTLSAYAQPKTNELPEILVSDGRTRLTTELKPAVEGTKIFSAKKVTSVELEKIPEVNTNNFRQLFSQFPGLLTSEVQNESFASISYRGIGDPHESFNIQTLADGIPISADMYGYSAAYYLPPSDYIEKIDFIRGGAALMYGPQPSGALNYQTRNPSVEPGLNFRSKHVYGSRALYNTYNEVSGTERLEGDDSVGYLLAFHQRQGNGFRSENSDYRITFGSAKVQWNRGDHVRLYFQQDAYDTAHGEPGGLTLDDGEGLATLGEDRWQSTLKFDTLSIRRYMTSFGAERDVSEDTTVSARIWTGFLSRNSKRQSLGTATGFGGFANGETNQIQLQEFKTIGGEARVKRDWELFGEEHTLSGGALFLGVNSPFTQEQGATPDAEVGELRRRIDRETTALSVFAENRFVFGDLSIVPGVRIENIYQNLDELVNVGATTPLRSANSFDFVPLAGIGASYVLPYQLELYGNFSQAFKPVTFQDTLPLGPADEVSEDIAPGRVNNSELGIRGRPAEYLSWDSSLFYTTYSNQFGRVGNRFGNTGRGRYYGLDLAAEVDLIGGSDDLLGTELGKDLGSISLYGNSSFLNAEYTRGALDGKTPQYAPEYLTRYGLIFRPREGTQFGLLGTSVGSHFADDGNTDRFFIPNYSVWDLTSQVEISDGATFVAGVNNLFNQNYYTRIRSNGIDPSLPINFYAGMDFRF